MKGNQNPRIKIEPPRVDTDGEKAAMLMHAYAVPLDEYQQLVLNAWLGKDAAGNYTALSAAISCPRQNGKTTIAVARILYGLAINGEHILYTAHQLKTARGVFRELENIFTNKQHPEMVQTVKAIRHGMGEESIELKNGGLIEFASRSRQAARGYAGISLVVFDEAQEVTDEHIAAIMSTLSASSTGTRQVIYLGTPPYTGCPGEVFRRFRESCIQSNGRGENTKSCWHEWSVAAERLDSIDISNKALWYESNPALGGRLTEEFTAEELKILSPADFARERLGFWLKEITTKDVLAIDPEVWERCKSDEERPEGKTAYGVKFTPDGGEVVLAGAVLPDPGKGKARITLLKVEPTGMGISWLAAWLNERYKQASAVVVDGRNGADVLIEKLSPYGGGTWAFKGSVIKPTAQNVVTAANMLLNDLNEGAVTWYSQQDELKESALTAVKRNIGGGWGFGGQTSAPIEACSLALWGCRVTKRNPLKKMRIC